MLFCPERCMDVNTWSTVMGLIFSYSLSSQHFEVQTKRSGLECCGFFLSAYSVYDNLYIQVYHT